MCVVSMVGDHFADKWNPFVQPGQPQPVPLQPMQLPPPVILIPASEYEQLKKDVLEMKELLKKAKLYDEKNNQVDCQKEEKVALLKAMAAHFGISLDDVFGKDKV